MKKLALVAVIMVLVGVMSVGVTFGDGHCDIEGPGESTTINMIGWAFPITEFYADELEDCSSVDNLEVETTLLDSASAREQVNLALSSDSTSPFEIIHADDGLIVNLAAEGWLTPLNDLIEQYSEEYGLDDIPASLFETATLDGQIYGIPFTANTMHLFYRIDLLEQYEIEVPETYDDIIAACGILQDEDSIELPFTINLHAGWAWRIEFHNFLGSFGGEWLNEDNTPAFNSPEGVMAVEKILEVVDACMGDEGLTYSIDDSEIGLEIGTVAMANIWASRAANMDNPELSLFVDGIGFAPAPRAVTDGAHGGPAATDFYAIPSNIDVDPELVFQVIMEAIDVTSQTEAAELGIPTRASVAESGIGGRYLPAAATTIANGAGSYGVNPAISLAQVAIENNLPAVGTGELTPAEALAAAEAEYIELATERGFLE